MVASHRASTSLADRSARTSRPTSSCARDRTDTLTANPPGGSPVIAIRISQSHLDAMIAHALEDAPIECCGMLAKKGDTVTALHRAKNREASPYRFSIDPLETKKI